MIEIELADARPGMVFVEDIRTTTGILLVARGQEVTERLAERIRNSLHMLRAKQVDRVIVPVRPQTAATTREDGGSACSTLFLAGSCP